jgi:uncharacterized protein (TIGR00251 family)
MADCVLSLRVTPRSSRDTIEWRDGELRIRLRAAPVEGQANEALLRLLAKRLGIPQADVEIVGGATSRTKRVRVHGLDEAAVRERLEAARRY